MTNTIKEKIAAFIAEDFLFREELEDLSTSDSLLDHGIIDSTGVLELVAFLEETFGLTVADAHIVPENLDSIDAITAFVVRTLEAPQTA